MKPIANPRPAPNPRLDRYVVVQCDRWYEKWKDVTEPLSMRECHDYIQDRGSRMRDRLYIESVDHPEYNEP